MHRTQVQVSRRAYRSKMNKCPVGFPGPSAKTGDTDFVLLNQLLEFAEEIRMKLVTVPEMLAIEKEADANGLSYAEMMENAGNGLADVILELIGQTEELEAFGLPSSKVKDGRFIVESSR